MLQVESDRVGSRVDIKPEDAVLLGRKASKASRKVQGNVEIAKRFSAICAGVVWRCLIVG